MTKRIGRKQLTTSGLRDFFQVQFLDLLVGLDGSLEPTTVHRTRRELKRLRAILRLTRPKSAEGTCQSELAILREVSQLFASSRDAFIIRQTGHEAIVELELDERWLEPLSAETPEELFFPPTQVVAQAKLLLMGVLIRSRNWKFSRRNASKLKRGLNRSMQEVKDRFRKCKRDKQLPDLLHRWRRSVKRLLFQELWLSRLNPTAKQRCRKLKRLEQDLGRAHDRWILECALRRINDPASEKNTEVSAEIIGEIARWRQKLENRCLKRGKRIMQKW